MRYCFISGLHYLSVTQYIDKKNDRDGYEDLFLLSPCSFIRGNIISHLYFIIKHM